MIVKLSVTIAGAPPRAFALERARLTVGPSSRCDVFVPAVSQALRTFAVEATASGFRIEPLDAEAALSFRGPDDDGWRPIEPAMLLPAGTVVRVGGVDAELTLVEARKAPCFDMERLGSTGQEHPDDFVGDLDREAAAAALAFAYDVGSTDDPTAVATALHRLVGDTNTVAVQLLLPAEGEAGWHGASSYGQRVGDHAIEQIGIADGDLHVALSRGEVLGCTRGTTRALVVPVAVASRLRALVVVHTPGPPRDAHDALRARLITARPLLLGFAARHAAAQAREAVDEENRYFKQRQRRHYLYKNLVTESVSMRRLHRSLGELVAVDVPVLLRGEAGTGKELLARALHHLGPRSTGLLVPIVCTTSDATALDIELFGIGAHSELGAVPPRRGVFELATGGTLFIDEVHALDATLQSKLLRAITEGEVFRLGESMSRRVDVRVVAATHVDLMALADEGRFRRDLALALSRHVLTVPPLRDRREDIGPLVSAFVMEFARRYRRNLRGVDAETMSWLQKLRWPGNVRELSMVIERAVLQSDPAQFDLHRQDFELR